jgi:hypothetical protein
MPAGRDGLLGGDGLDALAEPVVDVVEAAVADEQAVAAADPAVGEQHPLGLGGVDADAGGDSVGAAADVDRDRLGDLGGAG